MVVGHFRVNLGSYQKVLDQMGVGPKGDVQKFYTQNILRRIVKYMPYRSGATIKATQVQSSNTEIRSMGPHVQMLYFGKVMIDPKINAAGFQLSNGQWRSRKGSHKVVTNRDLQYTRTHNPLAGPFWDRRLMAAEGSQIVSETQDYINRKVVKL